MATPLDPDYELRGVRLRDVYRDKDGELWEVIALCDQPQVELRLVGADLTVSHVIGCANMQNQFPGKPLREQ